jgi:hypothetical protein
MFRKNIKNQEYDSNKEKIYQLSNEEVENILNRLSSSYPSGAILINSNDVEILENRHFLKLNNWLTKEKIKTYCAYDYWDYTQAACLSLGLDPDSCRKIDTLLGQNLANATSWSSVDFSKIKNFPYGEKLKDREDALRTWGNKFSPSVWVERMTKTHLDIYQFLKEGFEFKEDHETVYGVPVSDLPIGIKLAIRTFIECWKDLPENMPGPKKDKVLFVVNKLAGCTVVKAYDQEKGSYSKLFDAIYKLSKPDNSKSPTQKDGMIKFSPLSERTSKK